ncbi:DNA/RNA non-specific endonuclease [Neptuniibacter halophilus]|uniref:DNA/RNA non-specific endonuclease n=1 Tax=Neptuniibacter halophilus TaxID=651666 RepID=UPI0025733FF8|nr:DNA/RNA non-specific endonuclease [Neptuniibacter halophilus]
MIKQGYLLALLIPACVLPSTQAVAATDNYIHRKYEAFELVVDCEKRGAALFKATIGKDTGNQNRDIASFEKDPSIPTDCQQTQVGYYGHGYHRGHLLGANSAENTKSAYLETFYMTNVLPMTRELNVGAWHYSDKIIECLRDRGRPLTVLGGPIWNGPHSSSFTVASHGVSVPSAFWKVIKQGENQIAWIMPNSRAAVTDTLPQWESTVEEIEAAIGFEVPEELDPYRNYRPDSWYNTRGCDLK